jgi:carbonic anhydrase/acetyltransferase-like protein (isoleucine patch superfamily)
LIYYGILGKESMNRHRELTGGEIELLEQGGCTASDWTTVLVADGFDPNRVTNARFSGEVRIGRNDGTVNLEGAEHPCGIHGAVVAECSIGDQVLIANLGTLVRNYDIGDSAVIVDVASLVAGIDAAFGNGVRVNVLNETGGRGVTLFNDLSAQFAHVQALYRHDPEFQERLQSLVDDYVSTAADGRGRVARHAQLIGCGRILDTAFGPHARIFGARHLQNGTVLSCAEHPTVVGAGVVAHDFIISEGAVVDGGAVLSHCFVGQGAQVGKQCSVEHTLLFANSEAFHSEICSVFAGPYTVTHHKSTLLIASLWSFYNAGSGTNQSNHMYKLGPVHQGIFERGCKTGSFAYLMMECHIPAFCLIIGKHMSNIDIHQFPFSYLYEEEGKSMLMVGLNLFSVGTIRDGVKWPARDRRKAPKKRDQVIFDIMTPYTVGRMLKGREILRELYGSTPRTEKTVHVGGVYMKRVLLKKGIRYYTIAIDSYLIGAFMERLDAAAENGNADTWEGLCGSYLKAGEGIESETWSDVGGLIAPAERMDMLVREVKEGSRASTSEVLEYFELVGERFADDAWRFVHGAFEEEYGTPPEGLKPEQALDLLTRWEDAASTLHTLVFESVKSEFSGLARIGYGLDQNEERRAIDFEQVRGRFDTNAVVAGLLEEERRNKKRMDRLVKQIQGFL